MADIVGWHIDGDKIVFSLIDGEKDFEVVLPDDIYSQILTEGPPSEEKKTRELIDKIDEIKKNRLLFIDKILEIDDELRKATRKVRKELEDALSALKNANDKLEINKWKTAASICSAALMSIEKEKAILQEYRHLIKLTYQEEGKLRAKLLRSTRG